MFVDCILLIVGIALLIKGADFFVSGASEIAKALKIPPLVIGLTLVSMGTSMPEASVSVIGAINGMNDMSVGNVVGSNLFNVFVILGVCALIRPLALSRSNIRRDIPFGFVASLLLFLFASDRLLHLGTVDRIDRTDGIVMLVLYIGLLWFTVKTAGRSVASEHSAKPAKALWLTLVFIVVGLAGLVGGGELFLHHATVIARKLGVSESVIAITLVAGGTSLPELASSVVSVVKGKAGLALGNVLGSNIANILLILGVSATIRPLTMGGITTLDVSMVVLSSLLLFLTAFTFRRKTVDRWEGAIFLAIYAAYIWYLIK